MTRFIGIAGFMILVAGCGTSQEIYVFSVPDMMCEEGCVPATRAILAEQDGAEIVKIEFPAKIAIVVGKSGQFNSETALGDLIDHGFENSSIGTIATNKPDESAIQPAIDTGTNKSGSDDLPEDKESPTTAASSVPRPAPAP